MRPTGAALLLCTTLALALVAPARAALQVSQLARTYTLHSGRTTACPKTLTYTGAVNLQLPAARMRADGAACRGAGAKVLRSGSALRNAGLTLPALIAPAHVRFFAGVESATRVCGRHAFNATAVSYYLATTRSSGHRDAASGIALEAGWLYLVYAHFMHPCVLRARLSTDEVEGLAAVGRTGDAAADGGPAASIREVRPQRPSECFPSSATVLTRAGTKPMRDLSVGDEVLSSPGRYSRVYAFSHRDASAPSRFVSLTTDSGAVLRLTPGHLLPVNGRLAAAREVQPRDMLTLEDGSATAVRRVRAVADAGLYAPHTVDGSIVVDGVVASCYTDAVTATAAHALLSPVRSRIVRSLLTHKDLVERITNWARLYIQPSSWSR